MSVQEFAWGSLLLQVVKPFTLLHSSCCEHNIADQQMNTNALVAGSAPRMFVLHVAIDRSRGRPRSGTGRHELSCGNLRLSCSEGAHAHFVASLSARKLSMMLHTGIRHLLFGAVL
eukprot:284918-Amphidinium_carterae.1